MIIILELVRLLIDNYSINWDEKKFDKIIDTEDYIDYLNKEIIEFTTLAISSELPVENSKSIGLFLKTAGDLERIGDHAINIAKRAKKLNENQNSFSSEAMQEINEMNDLTMNVLKRLNTVNIDDPDTLIHKVDSLETIIDEKTSKFSYNQMLRLRDKKCIPENSALFTETLIDFKRVGEHGVNIANAFNEIKDVLTTI